jgi:hypothetical protein
VQASFDQAGETVARTGKRSDSLKQLFDAPVALVAHHVTFDPIGKRMFREEISSHRVYRKQLADKVKQAARAGQVVAKTFGDVTPSDLGYDGIILLENNEPRFFQSKIMVVRTEPPRDLRFLSESLLLQR